VSDRTSDVAVPAVLRGRIDELEADNRHLRIALESRIVIEQAKGVLVERFDLSPEAAFEPLRSAARRSRRPVRDVAAEIVKTRVTPGYLEHEIRHLLGGKGPVCPPPP
jgi:AmiR/NasT family two-component response regulator